MNAANTPYFNASMEAPIHRYLTPAISASCVAACACMLALCAQFGAQLSHLLLSGSVLAVLGMGLRSVVRLWQFSEFLDQLDGTVELGRPQASELKELQDQASGLRSFVETKLVSHWLTQLSQSHRYTLSSEQADALLRAARQRTSSIEGLNKGWAIGLPLLSIALGAWAYTEQNGALISTSAAPLVLGFAGAAWICLMHYLCHNVHRQFTENFIAWLEERSEVHSAGTRAEDDIAAQLARIQAAQSKVDKQLMGNEKALQKIAGAIQTSTRMLNTRIQLSSRDVITSLQSSLDTASLESDSGKAPEQAVAQASVPVAVQAVSPSSVMMDLEASNDEHPANDGLMPGESVSDYLARTA